MCFMPQRRIVAFFMDSNIYVDSMKRLLYQTFARFSMRPLERPHPSDLGPGMRTWVSQHRTVPQIFLQYARKNCNNVGKMLLSQKWCRARIPPSPLQSRRVLRIVQCRFPVIFTMHTSRLLARLFHAARDRSRSRAVTAVNAAPFRSREGIRPGRRFESTAH